MIVKKKVLFSLLCFALTLGLAIPISPPAEASSRIIHVPSNYPTIQAAVNAASPGDTIIVRDGTYTENVDVNKDHLTIQSQNGAEKTIVQAANADDNIFEVIADYVNISGFTVRGASEAPSCGIHLKSNNSKISNNTISNNYWGMDISSSLHISIINNLVSHNENGIFLTSSNSNTITNNRVSYNDNGIWLSSSCGNSITHNIASSNRFEGIFLQGSSDNTITNNEASYNNQDGIRLEFSLQNNVANNIASTNRVDGILLYGSNDNKIKGNSISSNGDFGIDLSTSYRNEIYLNNFVDNRNNVSFWMSTPNTWNSPEEITYTYKGKTYTNYLGNYWSDYTGSDADGDGIGDIPYSIDSDKDNYPLVKPFENYMGKPEYVGRFIATAYAYPEEQDSRFGSSSSARTRIQVNRKDGSVIYVDVKRLFYSAMTLNGGGLVNDNPQNYTHLVKWTLVNNIFEEIEEVTGSQGRPLIPRQSIAIWPTKELTYGNRGYFVVLGTNETYEFSADDTCPAAQRKNQIDVWLGVGKEAYGEALKWGRKVVNIYRYKVS